MISSGSCKALSLMVASMYAMMLSPKRAKAPSLCVCYIQEGPMESTMKDQEYEGPLSYLGVTRKFSLGTPIPHSQSMGPGGGSMPSSGKQTEMPHWTTVLVPSFQSQ